MPLDERARPPALLAGLRDEDRGLTAREYFASFRWEPPPIDPASLTASKFLALLDDVADPDASGEASEREAEGARAG